MAPITFTQYKIISGTLSSENIRSTNTGIVFRRGTRISRYVKAPQKMEPLFCLHRSCLSGKCWLHGPRQLGYRPARRGAIWIYPYLGVAYEQPDGAAAAGFEY